MVNKRKHKKPSRKPERNKRLKVLLPPKITDEELAELRQQNQNIYRYGPFVVLTDHLQQSVVADAENNMLMIIEGILDRTLDHLDALMAVYPEPMDEASDEEFYGALAEVAYQFEVMVSGEMLMELESIEDMLDDDQAAINHNGNTLNNWWNKVERDD